MEQRNLGVKTPAGGYECGKVEVSERPMEGKGDLLCSVGPVAHKEKNKHPVRLRRLTSDLAAECAVDSAALLIEEAKEDEFDECGPLP